MAFPRRIAMESSNLHSIGWERNDPLTAEGQLDVYFKNRDGSEGAHYAYSDVPAVVVLDLIFAESQGSFFNENIKHGASDGKGYEVERIS